MLKALNRYERSMENNANESKTKMTTKMQQLIFFKKGDEKPKPNDPFKRRYNYSQGSVAYKSTLNSRVQDACRMYGTDIFKHCDTSIIPVEELNKGASYATMIVSKSLNGDLSRDLAANLLSNGQDDETSVKLNRSNKSLLSIFQNSTS